MKKIVSLALVTVLLFMMVVPASAANADNTVQPRWTYLNIIDAGLDINWLGIATCEGNVLAYGNTTVKVVVRLQQQTDSGWSTLKTWSDTDTGSAYASGIYAVHSGYTYRVSVIAYAYDANGNLLETGSTSDTLVY